MDESGTDGAICNIKVVSGRKVEGVIRLQVNARSLLIRVLCRVTKRMDESILQRFYHIERMGKLFSRSTMEEMVDSMNDCLKKEEKGLDVEKARRMVHDRNE